MTGLNAIAQWLLGGGGAVLKFVLYVFVAWVLVGALPRMRRDAAAKVPQVRGVARDRMREHAAAAEAAGRGKGAEWWGWTAAAGTLAVAHEGARFGGYMITSAWHGWGDHRRRVRALRMRSPWRRPAVTPPGPAASPPSPPPSPPPGDGGPPHPPPPDRPGGPPREAGPSPPSAPDHPAAPPRDEGPATGPPQYPGAGPAHSGAGGNDGAEVIPMPPPGLSPAGQENEGAPMADAEISNLEAALRVVSQMQAEARQALDAAQAEKAAAEQAMRNTEQASENLAAAGVSGPVMEAFVRYHEATEMAERAAAAKVVACDMALAAANSARGALAAHQDAADQLAATGGAARDTGWYVPGNGGGDSAPPGWQPATPQDLRDLGMARG
jgi:hypothetical protein